MPTTPIWNANDDIIQGSSYQLYLLADHKIVAYGTEASLELSAETNSISSKFSCDFADQTSGTKSYTINTSSLYMDETNTHGISFDTLVAAMVSGKQIEWALGSETDFTGACDENPHTFDASANYFNGMGIITSCSMNANNGEACTCSATITGCGPIEKNGAPIDTSMFGQ